MLKQTGFLLESDPKLPSVATLIAGEPLRGSWWSHPRAQEIFQVNEKLDDHNDVLITKLISGKVTFVHRKLWSELAAIGDSREPWQLQKLADPARTLLKQVEAAGSLTTGQITWPRNQKMKLGDAARELEKRLLIVGTQFHSESGAHEKQLQTWEHWLTQKNFKPKRTSSEKAKHLLEAKLQKLNIEFSAAGFLPWL